MRELLVTASTRFLASSSSIGVYSPSLVLPLSNPFPLPLPFHSVMTTPHVIASSSTHTSQPATTTGVVGNHFRVGKKIGEGSFGVVFEGVCFSFPSVTPKSSAYRPPPGSNLLTNHPVAIKFVCHPHSERKPSLTCERLSGTSQVGRTPTAR
jgi:hypothetical protein